ncbi:hypothetical protein DN069_04285 [Streptacidiphilus pinicola]|uniref:Uncharacterized protein n=1 Tax=Streptacidiphilus pinicola TaxID=2219663 RepID=A0A2X0KIN6_9ACTN|nr:hypothetical protein [Streptacidiphilus pinicola]RAG86879.1 hypothetical protein DN069_04285 [Streptacidiphilus pinicola]
MTAWGIGLGDARHERLAEALRRYGLWDHLTPEQRRAAASDVARGQYPFDFELLYQQVEFFADGETLAEGGVERFLREIAPVVERHGVRLSVESVPTDESEYAVLINGVRLTVRQDAEAAEPDPWTQATVRPLAVLNDLLAAAGASPVRAHVLYPGGNDTLLLLLDPRAVAAMRASGLFPEHELPALAVTLPSVNRPARPAR